MTRRPRPDEEKILNELARSVDPSAEALERLMYELEHSPIVRKAFAAEMVRNRQFAALCRDRRRDLPKKVNEALDTLADRSPSFEILRARAERAGEASPQLELQVHNEEGEKTCAD